MSTYKEYAWIKKLMADHIEALNKIYSGSSTSPEALAHLKNLVEFVRVIHKRSHDVRSWARKVNSIPTFRSRSIFNANYDSQGKLSVDLEYSKDFFLDEGTGLWGTSKKAIEDICWAIERLKHALGNPGLRKFIGVCDYAKCKTPFFIRSRKDQRFCKKTHAMSANKLRNSLRV